MIPSPRDLHDAVTETHTIAPRHAALGSTEEEEKADRKKRMYAKTQGSCVGHERWLQCKLIID
jgi:hypothetical protein